MAEPTTHSQNTCQARRLAIKLQPPCVYLEYVEWRDGQPPKPRVRTVNLPTLTPDADVVSLTNKVMLSFPRALNPTTIKQRQLQRLITKLVAHAAQQQQDAPLPQQKAALKQDEAADGSQLHKSRGTQMQSSIASNDTIIVSLLQHILSSPTAASLAQQLQSQAPAKPMQRCVQQLDWAFQVYANIPASHRKAVPHNNAPSADLLASIAAAVKVVGKQPQQQDDTTDGLIAAHRPDTQQVQQRPSFPSTSSSDKLTKQTPPQTTWASITRGTAPSGVEQPSRGTAWEELADEPDMRETPTGGATHDTMMPSASTSQPEGVRRNFAPAQKGTVVMTSDDDDDLLTLEFEVDGTRDLNKASDYELRLAKEAMDKDFQKALLRPGDPGYEYDRAVQFGPPKEPNDWDDEGSSESVF